MNREELIKDINNEPEMHPDEYDGSYELMREIVASYSTLANLSNCDYHDLNAIYMMAVGTWKANIEKKKEYVQNGHLPNEEKARMEQILDRIWDNSCKSKYKNRQKDNPSIGMFGTGFYSFENKTTDDCVQSFIKMLVDISEMNNENDIFDRTEQVLGNNYKGMRAASASVVLHCLKPTVFPILNGNMGKGNIFGVLEVDLDKPADVSTYIDNCRKIRDFRDANLSIKNYRILDLYARKLENNQTDDFYPSLEEYNPGITKEQWIEFLEKDRIKSPKTLLMLKTMLDMGGEASCKALSEKLKESPSAFVSRGSNLGKRAKEYFEIEFYYDKEDGKPYRFVVPFTGRSFDGYYEWRLREELKEALLEMDLSDLEDMSIMKADFELNTILYGPPGTGKTYNSINYAVAICEGKTIKDIESEEYEDVILRFNELKKAGRIEFTTFHQSYGYEDFIEGIKPITDVETGNISYEVTNGVFKDFCEKAELPTDIEVNHDAQIYIVRLKGNGDNDLKRECFCDNEIRFDWSEDYNNGWMKWFSEMKAGDYVLSYHSKSKIIDGIGIVMDEEPFYDENKQSYKWTRKVEWLVSNKEIDIYEANNGKYLSNFHVGRVPDMKLSSLLALIDNDSNTKKEQKPYVFIIDEINRGNISKIFGELITLIENTKRKGCVEGMTAILPYSHSVFSVPDNVYILGTMNTADRSIALMDTALRRRFSFVEMMPDSKVLDDIGVGTIIEGDKTLNVSEMLNVINMRIEYLYDREHTIGHAFFIKLVDSLDIDTLADIFKKNVIPLLQEYFYEDYAKIQFILGDNEKEDKYKFILDESLDIKNVFNGMPDVDLPDKKYRIHEEAFYDIESYISIGKNL